MFDVTKTILNCNDIKSGTSRQVARAYGLMGGGGKVSASPSFPYQYQTNRKINKNVGPIFRPEAARLRTESAENRPEEPISGFRGLVTSILITPSCTGDEPSKI